MSDWDEDDLLGDIDYGGDEGYYYPEDDEGESDDYDYGRDSYSEGTLDRGVSESGDLVFDYSAKQTQGDFGRTSGSYTDPRSIAFMNLEKALIDFGTSEQQRNEIKVKAERLDKNKFVRMNMELLGAAYMFQLSRETPSQKSIKTFTSQKLNGKVSPIDIVRYMRMLKMIK